MFSVKFVTNRLFVGLRGRAAASVADAAGHRRRSVKRRGREAYHPAVPQPKRALCKSNLLIDAKTGVKKESSAKVDNSDADNTMGGFIV